MNRSQRLLAAAVAAVALVIAAGWFTLISPQRSHASELQAQAATQEQKNISIQAQIKTRTAQEKNVVAEQARVAAIAQQIPATISLASYVRMLTDAAAKAKVDLKSVAPGPPVLVQLAKQAAKPAAVPSAKPSASATAGKATSAAAAPTTASSSLSAVPVQLQVAGGYFQIQQFLANLQGLTRATDVTSVTLAPGGAAQPAPASTSTASAAPVTPPWQVLTGTISLTIFMTNAPLPALTSAAPAPSPSPSH